MSKISRNIDQLQEQLTILSNAYYHCISAEENSTTRSYHIEELKKCIIKTDNKQLVTYVEQDTQNYTLNDTPSLSKNYIKTAMSGVIYDAAELGGKTALDDQAKSKQAAESEVQMELATLTSENENLKKQLAEQEQAKNNQKQLVKKLAEHFQVLHHNFSMFEDSINSDKGTEYHNEQEHKTDSQAQEETETQEFKVGLASFTNNATTSTANAANSVTANEQAYSTANEEKDQSDKPFWDINGEVSNNTQQDNTEVPVTGNVNEQLSEHHS